MTVDEEPRVCVAFSVRQRCGLWEGRAQVFVDGALHLTYRSKRPYPNERALRAEMHAITAMLAKRFEENGLHTKIVDAVELN